MAAGDPGVAVAASRVKVGVALGEGVPVGTREL
jgi:hypothetical protein